MNTQSQRALIHAVGYESQNNKQDKELTEEGSSRSFLAVPIAMIIFVKSLEESGSQLSGTVCYRPYSTLCQNS